MEAVQPPCLLLTPHTGTEIILIMGKGVPTVGLLRGLWCQPPPSSRVGKALGSQAQAEQLLWERPRVFPAAKTPSLHPETRATLLTLVLEELEVTGSRWFSCDRGGLAHCPVSSAGETQS